MWKTRLTLTPGANGTKKPVARYGDRLVCVRYRYDPERRRRIKTVELVEDESEWTPSGALYLVEIGWNEAELRQNAKTLGARWDSERRLWQMNRETVRALHLESRIRSRYLPMDLDIQMQRQASTGGWEGGRPTTSCAYAAAAEEVA